MRVGDVKPFDHHNCKNLKSQTTSLEPQSFRLRGGELDKRKQKSSQKWIVANQGLFAFSAQIFEQPIND